MKKRIIGIVIFLAVISLSSAWYLGVFRQLEPEDQNPPPAQVVQIAPGMGLQDMMAQPKPLPVKPFDIDWPASSTIDRELLNNFSEKVREGIDKSSAPVLMPSVPKKLGDVAMSAGKGGYDAHISNDDIPIIMHVFAAGEGGGKAPSIPSPYMPDRVRGLPADIGETEGGRYVTWNEFGAAYYLEIRCFRLPKDSRCTSDAYLREIVENLHYVGGRGK